MTKANRYIALILLLILSGAYTYRYVHVGEHQSLLNHERISSHPDEGQKVQNQRSEILSSTLSEIVVHEICLICDFDFYVQDISPEHVINAASTRVLIQFKQLLVDLANAAVPSNKIPRAPPQ
ncbi:MAG TPA: hypothetical protein DDX92_10100 [Flavobacteriales bacterium]|jgi:hypothetical protein|nr:hypothetical protein [Flavobacteriales bacterium]